MNKFAERLKELREEHDLSMNSLANKIGYTHKAISNWENGIQSPNIEALIVLANFFEVSADYLLGLEN